MTEAEQILAAADSVLVVDWPSSDVPDALTALASVIGLFSEVGAGDPIGGGSTRS